MIHTPTSRGDGARTPLLAHRTVTAEHAQPARWVMFLHGFLGAGRNWASIGRGLVQARPDWGAVLVDLRLHGNSTGFAPPHTVAACAADVNALALHLRGREFAILGHSFGGKVALAASRSPGPSLRQVWVMDSTPERGQTGPGAGRLLTLLRGMPSRYGDRREAVAIVEGAGFPAVLAQWVATNLERGPDGYHWRLDLAALEFLLADFYREELWDAVQHPAPGVDLVFVRARTGSILSDAAASRIARLSSDGVPVRLVEIAGGHWLNMSNPGGVLSLLAEGLPA